MVRIGVSFDGFSPLRESVAFAKEAEEAGAASLWMAEHLGYREAILSAMACAAATKRTMVFPTAVSPYLRHPMAVAMAMATLAEAAPGRTGIAVGVGNPLFLQESGILLEKPLRVVREYVECLKALWTGEPVHSDGGTFRLAGARMAFRPPEPVPVYLAPIREGMLRLAGRAADGVVLSSGITVEYTVRSLALVAEGAKEAGRDPASVQPASYLMTSVSREKNTAYAAVRTKLAFLLRNKYLEENIRASGITFDQGAIIRAVARRDLEEASRLVPDEAIEAFTVSGAPRDCLDRMEAYRKAGLDELVLVMTGAPGDRKLALTLIKEFGSP
jgi:5,10-methylenetetrahydromethanopterin reductase